MIDIVMQYQAIVYVDAKDITPAPDIITGLVKTFRERELIPNTFQEVNVLSPAPQTRLRLSSPNGEWGVLFATNKIEITKNPVDPKGANLGELSTFCSDVSDFYGRILKTFSKRANRIALVTSFLLKEMTDNHLSAFYQKLFRPPQFYVANPPFEWNWRSAARISSDFAPHNEKLNVLMTLNRVRGDFKVAFGLQPFERLQLILDINTIQENSDYRFKLSHIKSFYARILRLHGSLLTEILEYMSE